MTMSTEVQSWIGLEAMDSDEAKVGKIDQVYVDRETGDPEWLAVKTGLFGSKVSFVPLEGARIDGDHVDLAYAKDQIKDAPNVENDGELSDAEERALYEHYGRGWGDFDRDRFDARDTTVGHDTSGPTTDDAMTRSEEELRVGTAQRESGRARLRKYVVTEEQSVSVPVRREEVRVERESITDANRDQALDGPEISEEEHEVVLHEEVPVVDKQVVPKERVRMDTETLTDDAQVTEEVRKERIDAEGDAGSDR
ncbi:MAG: photosystem reaction center subunit [Solirubrobacterales bacterium]|nr:photosystem reaction center subunit [Solirubrobacterales bacterium]